MYQRLEAVAWHLILRAVSSKMETKLAVRKGSTDTTRMFDNLRNKSIVSREEHWLRRKKITW